LQVHGLPVLWDEQDVRPEIRVITAAAPGDANVAGPEVSTKEMAPVWFHLFM
jgi:hypothetical protein